MLSLIPWYYRLLALIVAAGALWGVGWYYGHKSGKAAGEADLAHFRASVETAAAAAAVHTQQVIAAQQEVTQNVASDYEKKLAALRARPASVRVEYRADGSTVAALPGASCSPDGRPADAVPAAVTKADFDQLYQASAETTQQLVSLQAWVREQQAAFP